MKKVLIVEDEAILAMMHRKFIEKLGYQVTACVTTGANAIYSAKIEEPDLILMDISIIGGMDGIESMVEIRKSCNAPVIFISGNSDPAARRRAKTISNSTFITKPVDNKVLHNSIIMMLGTFTPQS
jgi:CheY-like chemotaxis protein